MSDKKRILVIDDVKIVCMAFEAELADHGFEACDPPPCSVTGAVLVGEWALPRMWKPRGSTVPYRHPYNCQDGPPAVW